MNLTDASVDTVYKTRYSNDRTKRIISLLIRLRKMPVVFALPLFLAMALAPEGHAGVLETIQTKVNQFLNSEILSPKRHPLWHIGIAFNTRSMSQEMLNRDEVVVSRIVW